MKLTFFLSALVSSHSWFICIFGYIAITNKYEDTISIVANADNGANIRTFPYHVTSLETVVATIVITAMIMEKRKVEKVNIDDNLPFACCNSPFTIEYSVEIISLALCFINEL